MESHQADRIALSLVRGEILPPENETIAYLTKQTQGLQIELEALVANANGLQMQLDRMSRRKIEIEAIQRKYVEDIGFWLKKEPEETNTEITNTGSVS